MGDLDSPMYLQPQQRSFREDTIHTNERVLLGLFFFGYPGGRLTGADEITGWGLSTIRDSAALLSEAIYDRYLDEAIVRPEVCELRNHGVV